jgi:hypothetical protein
MKQLCGEHKPTKKEIFAVGEILGLTPVKVYGEWTLE